MYFLGFDLGANFGFAVLDQNCNRIDSGTWYFGVKTTKSLLSCDTKVTNLISQYPPVIISYEKVNFFHKGTKAASAYGNYEAIVMLAAERNDTLLDQFSTGKVKKVATGFGNATKKEMEAAAYYRWNSYVPMDDNDADALHIARCGLLRFIGEKI